MATTNSVTHPLLAASTRVAVAEVVRLMQSVGGDPARFEQVLDETISVLTPIQRRFLQVQAEHRHQLEALDAKGRPEVMKDLVPFWTLYCMNIEVFDTKHWKLVDIVQYGNRCVWEQRMRGYAVKGENPDRTLNRYPQILAEKYANRYRMNQYGPPAALEGHSANSIRAVNMDKSRNIRSQFFQLPEQEKMALPIMTPDVERRGLARQGWKALAVKPAHGDSSSVSEQALEHETVERSQLQLSDRPEIQPSVTTIASPPHTGADRPDMVMSRGLQTQPNTLSPLQNVENVSHRSVTGSPPHPSSPSGTQAIGGIPHNAVKARGALLPVKASPSGFSVGTTATSIQAQTPLVRPEPQQHVESAAIDRARQRITIISDGRPPSKTNTPECLPPSSAGAGDAHAHVPILTTRLKPQRYEDSRWTTLETVKDKVEEPLLYERRQDKKGEWMVYLGKGNWTSARSRAHWPSIGEE